MYYNKGILGQYQHGLQHSTYETNYMLYYTYSPYFQKKSYHLEING